jgi:hypothetical protein
MTSSFTSSELIYQINTHLLYELKWMLFAAIEFKRCEEQGHNKYYMPLIDSSLVHARNLFEFISMNKPTSFTLVALGGTVCDKPRWRRFLNNRVTHMYDREHDKASWPDGLDNTRNDRFMLMADTVLTLLETQGASIIDPAIRKAFDNLTQTARAYLSNPTDTHFHDLEVLYDNSQDGVAY